MDELYYVLTLLAALWASFALVDVYGLGWLATCADIYLYINCALLWLSLL